MDVYIYRKDSALHRIVEASINHKVIDLLSQIYRERRDLSAICDVCGELSFSSEYIEGIDCYICPTCATMPSMS